MQLQPNERIDDLQFNGLKIIQDKEKFCFGIDSVLLSDFASSIKKNSKVMDLGTGNGILGLLLCKKTKLSEIIGVEIQEEVAKIAQRNVELNQLENQFRIINENIKNLPNFFERNSQDVIITNPPYQKLGTGMKNENEFKTIARHEITATLEDFITISAYLLKENGSFFMVHKVERLVDIVTLLRNKKLEPKRMRLIMPTMQKEPNLVLIEAVKNANPFLKIEPNLMVYEENGEYTKEIFKIYGKEKGENL